MKNAMIILSLSLFLIPLASNAQCQKGKVVLASHQLSDVVDIAMGSDEHTTLVAAVKAAGLVETLKGDGPFTVFAPTNAAFDKLPEGTVADLLKPENKGKLTSILTYHVISGSLDSKQVVAAIEAGDGVAKVTTVEGGVLEVMLEDNQVVLKDENGNKSTITAVDLMGDNGVVHIIDTVVLPK